MQKQIKEEIKTNRVNRVWIGDPCYVIADGLWDGVVDQIYRGNQEEAGFKIEFTAQELLDTGVMDSVNMALPLAFIQCGTMYGDGVYTSQSGFEYPVDAGCLAMIPDYLIHPDKYKSAKELGKFFIIDNREDQFNAEDGTLGLKTDGRGTFEFTHNDKVIETIYTDYYEDE